MAVEQNRKSTHEVRIVGREQWGPDLQLVDGAGSFREIIGPSCGARARGLYHVELAAGSRTAGMRHSEAEAVYYVLQGTGVVVDRDQAIEHDLREGSMVHVEASAGYLFTAHSHLLLIGGPCPVVHAPRRTPDDVPTAPGQHAVRTFHRDEPGMMVPFISRDARLVVWLGVGAQTANMNYVVMQPGERNTEHVHRYSEDTIFIVSGHGTVEDVTNRRRLDIGPGDTVHISPGIWHAVAADRGEVLVSAGGPCPADLDMLAAVGVDVSDYVEDEAAYIKEVGVR